MEGLGLGKGDYLLAVSVGLVADRYSATALNAAVAATFSRFSRMIDMMRLLGGCTFLIPIATANLRRRATIVTGFDTKNWTTQEPP